VLLVCCLQVISRNATHDTVYHSIKVNASEALEIALAAAASTSSPSTSSMPGIDTFDKSYEDDKNYRLCPLSSRPAVGQFD
jgi:hypothetical protein